MYKNKYLKYKNKYLELKNKIGGSSSQTQPREENPPATSQLIVHTSSKFISLLNIYIYFHKNKLYK